MDRSFHPNEWKPQETTGKRWKASHPLSEEVPDLPPLELGPVPRLTFRQALLDSATNSAMEHQEIADEIHISPGYMSKFLASVGEQWARRLIKFMRVTRSLGPLQWIADQMGCDVTVRSALSAELAAAYARIAEHERRGGRLI